MRNANNASRNRTPSKPTPQRGKGLKQPRNGPQSTAQSVARFMKAKNPTVFCEKTYVDFPFAHRQHNHDGHCAQIHGHNWSFKFSFRCNQRDANDFVVDFGKLGFIKEFLTEHFDHTLVLNADDPMTGHLHRWLAEGMNLAKIVSVPNCGAEGLAVWILRTLNARYFQNPVSNIPEDWRRRGVRILSVEVFEDSKNSAVAIA